MTTPTLPETSAMPASGGEVEALVVRLRAVDGNSDLCGVDADAVAIAANALLRLQREAEWRHAAFLALAVVTNEWKTRAEAAERELAEAKARIGEAVAAEREACAVLVGPTTERPCDCERCYCQNVGDCEGVASWDSQFYLAQAIRARAGEQSNGR